MKMPAQGSHGFVRRSAESTCSSSRLGRSGAATWPSEDPAVFFDLLQTSVLGLKRAIVAATPWVEKSGGLIAVVSGVDAQAPERFVELGRCVRLRAGARAVFCRGAWRKGRSGRQCRRARRRRGRARREPRPRGGGRLGRCRRASLGIKAHRAVGQRNPRCRCDLGRGRSPRRDAHPRRLSAKLA